MSLDILNPSISVVSEGLEGKVILLTGGNSTGKTKQATRMSKPLYLAFEKGINAISGIPYVNIDKWADFRKVNRQLTGKEKDKARELYNTIIFDTVDAAALMNERYIAGQHGATDIASGRDGFGLWRQLETEFYEQISALTGVGYTVVFIGHVERDKHTEQMNPKGDKRSMGIVRDLADIIVYLESNGVDEDGNVVLSTGYVRETPEYFARSRFDFMPNVIDPFTAENLEEAIKIGIQKEKEAGGKTVDFKEFAEQNAEKKLDFLELKSEIIKIGQAFYNGKKIDKFKEHLADMFNEGHQPFETKDLSEKQVEAMAVFIDDMYDKYEDFLSESDEEE